LQCRPVYETLESQESSERMKEGSQALVQHLDRQFSLLDSEAAFERQFSLLEGEASSAPSKVTKISLDESLIRDLQALAGPKEQHITERFKTAIELSLRVALATTLVLIPSAHPALAPGELGDWMKWSSFLVPAMLLSAMTSLGSTVAKASRVFLGTVLAVINALILAMLRDGDAIVASIDFVIVSFFMLWIDVDVNVKIFALGWTVFFVITFANPSVTLAPIVYWSLHSGMACIMCVTSVGCLGAVLAFVLPYPRTAMNHARKQAARSAREVAGLFAFVAMYYSGKEKTIAVYMWQNQIKALHREIHSMGDDLDAAWWEGFDIGRFGTTRHLLQRHLDYLKQVSTLLFGLKVCASREDFMEEHQRAIEPVRDVLSEVACAAGDLLMAATIAANDSYFSAEEITMLEQRATRVEKAVKDLADGWHELRCGSPEEPLEALSSSLLTESFFVYEVSAYGRLVVDFTRSMLHEPPCPWSSCISKQALCSYLQRPFRKEHLFGRQQLNFTLRNFLSLNIACFLGLFGQGYNMQIPTFVSLMLSKDIGAALRMNMGRMQGTVLGMLIGYILFEYLHSCETIFVCLRIMAQLTFQVCVQFIHYYSSEFGFIGLLLAIFGGKALAQPCEETIDRAAAVDFAFHSFKSVAMALGIVTAVDMLLKREMASVMARKSLFGAVDSMIDTFGGFLMDRPVQPVMTASSSISTNLAEAVRFGVEADQEARWHRTPFRIDLFKELCHIMNTLNSDLLTVQRAFRGVHDRDNGLMNDGLMNRVVNVAPVEFRRVRQGIMNTMDEVRRLTHAVLEHEHPGDLDARLLQDLQKQKSIQHLDGLQELLERIKGVYSEKLRTKPPPATMEEDEVCRLCVVFEMLDSAIFHASKAITSTVEYI